MQKQTVQSLGTLTKEQKEQMWEQTISGSQAWNLAYEPYNLIRKKLKVPLIHKSKNDIFENDNMKTFSTSAMAQGSLYESTVLAELKTNEEFQNSVSQDICYSAVYPEGHILNGRVTATPDFLTLNEEGIAIILGEIKCSVSASSKTIMNERYRQQVLHNCYVLGLYNAVLVTKNEITKPMNIYRFNFTDADFEEWENKLITFWTNFKKQSDSSYDGILEFNTMLATPDGIVELEPTEDMKTLINSYDALNKQKLQIDKQLKAISGKLKDNYENATCNIGPLMMVIKTSIAAPKVDYEAVWDAVAEMYKLDIGFLEDFKVSKSSQTFSIKEVKVK